MCQKKGKYRTFEDAENAMYSLSRRTGTAIFRLEVYRCNTCNVWHYGHKKFVPGKRNRNSSRKRNRY